MEKECPHCQKKKERSDGEYRKLINRLNRISGQINGIKKMVENSAYCTDIRRAEFFQQGAARGAYTDVRCG